MTDDIQPLRLQVNGRNTLLAEDLVSVFQAAEKPLTLGELSQRLGRPFRTVAVFLSAACRAGTVDPREGGLYALRLRPELTELFAIVRACEAQWEGHASTYR